MTDRRTRAGRQRRPRISAATRASSSARSTRRCSARRRSSFRPWPTWRPRRAATHPGITYGLHGLPTVPDLQAAFAELEGGHAALRGALGPDGDDAAAARAAARRRPRARHRFGVRTDAPLLRLHLTRYGIDGRATTIRSPGAAIEREFRPNTRVVFTESPGSLTFEVQDIPAIAAVAHARGAKVVLDNTWATPLYFRAFDHGVDVSVHAATKYLGGHSDVLLGLIVANAATYPALHRFWTDTGVTASSRRLLPRPARPAHARRAPRAASAERARDRAVAARAARGARSDLPGAAGRARARAVEARFHRRDGALRRRAAAGGQGAHRRDARRHAAVRDGLELGRLRKPHHPDWPERMRTATRWDAGGPCLRLHVGLEDPADLIADLATDSRGLRAGLRDLGYASVSSPRYTACTRGSARMASGGPCGDDRARGRARSRGRRSRTRRPCRAR